MTEQQRHEKERISQELAKVRDELIRKTRLAAIGQVSASIVHDLRNPLGSVRNANYLLRRRLKTDNIKITSQLDVIDQEINHADQIITNLLAIARSRPPRKQKVDIALLIAGVMANTTLHAGVSLHFDINPDPCFIYCDPDQFKQVISNLLENAVQAVAKGGQCWIQVQQTQTCDTLTFRDDGPGISADVRETLFEPLATTKANGTGLGLTISRQIIEAHGGRIDVEPPPEGGTLFKIRLPRETKEGLGETGGDV